MSIKEDIFNIVSGQREFNPEVFINPDKYSVFLPISKVVADSKVSRRGVNIYKQKIKNKEKLDPIIVVKHPKKDLYAVLDGHHRYHATFEMNKKEIKCAILGDYSNVIFYLTKNGFFQPDSTISEPIRQAIFKLQKNINQFLEYFKNYV